MFTKVHTIRKRWVESVYFSFFCRAITCELESVTRYSSRCVLSRLADSYTAINTVHRATRSSLNSALYPFSPAIDSVSNFSNLLPPRRSVCVCVLLSRPRHRTVFAAASVSRLSLNEEPLRTRPRVSPRVRALSADSQPRRYARARFPLCTRFAKTKKNHRSALRPFDRRPRTRRTRPWEKVGRARLRACCTAHAVYIISAFCGHHGVFHIQSIRAFLPLFSTYRV